MDRRDIGLSGADGRIAYPGSLCTVTKGGENRQSGPRHDPDLVWASIGHPLPQICNRTFLQSFRIRSNRLVATVSADSHAFRLRALYHHFEPVRDAASRGVLHSAAVPCGLARRCESGCTAGSNYAAVDRPAGQCGRLFCRRPAKTRCHAKRSLRSKVRRVFPTDKERATRPGESAYITRRFFQSGFFGSGGRQRIHAKAAGSREYSHGCAAAGCPKRSTNRCCVGR